MGRAGLPDTQRRLHVQPTSSTVSLAPAPLVATFSYNAIGNLTYKSDVGAYSYPAPGQPRPHGVASISGGAINTSFTYDAKGNMTSGNGLSIAYTAFNKPATITRGTTTIAFDHDPELQRYAQTGPGGVTLYLSAMGVLAEKFRALGGPVRWTNYLMAGGRLIGIHVENSDETTLTRYFHTDHLGSIAVITNEVGAVAERLSYDAWGHPDGTPEPLGLHCQPVEPRLHWPRAPGPELPRHRPIDAHRQQHMWSSDNKGSLGHEHVCRWLRRDGVSAPVP